MDKKTDEYTFGKMWKDAGILSYKLREEWDIAKGQRVSSVTTILGFTFLLPFSIAFEPESLLSLFIRQADRLRSLSTRWIKLWTAAPHCVSWLILRLASWESLKCWILFQRLAICGPKISRLDQRIHLSREIIIELLIFLTSRVLMPLIWHSFSTLQVVMET